VLNVKLFLPLPSAEKKAERSGAFFSADGSGKANNNSTKVLKNRLLFQNVKELIMPYNQMSNDANIGMYRSVENVRTFLPVHPVRDASLTGCCFCREFLRSTERRIPNGTYYIFVNTLCVNELHLLFRLMGYDLERLLMAKLTSNVITMSA